MAVITDSLLVDILLLLASGLYLVYWFISRNTGYWDKRGVGNTKKWIFIAALLKKKSHSDSIKELYEEFSGKRYAGFLQITKPVLMVRDLDLINKILVKDFTQFQDRGQPQFKKDALSLNLFNLSGQKWRHLRYKLTPTFTSGKLKRMFEQLSKSGQNMIGNIQELTKENDAVESKSFTFEFALDVIASSAFGVQFPPGSPEFDQFKVIVKKFFSGSPIFILKFALVTVMPKLGQILGLSMLSDEIRDYFLHLVKTTLKFRKDNNIKRNDYFQLLMTLKEQEESGNTKGLTTSDATEDDALVDQMQFTEQSNQPTLPDEKLFTDELITANSFIFLAGGSESTANTISFVLFELTQHPEIQQRVQQEVDLALAKHGGWSYEAVKYMTYLDQVIQESQRLYPLMPMLVRECVEPYKVPDSDLVIEKGVLICIPISGLHMDPQYYPDPERFDPDRFLGNNYKPNSTYLPFGDGPRICIALRFAVMEVKTCVARIMSQYSVKLSDKTPLPLKLKKESFVPAVDGGIWLQFEQRKGEVAF